MVLGSFVLAHWLGLLWYAVAIKPLEAKYSREAYLNLTAAGALIDPEDWQWHWLEEGGGTSVSLRYAAPTAVAVARLRSP